jgi:hypothetical protein
MMRTARTDCTHPWKAREGWSRESTIFPTIPSPGDDWGLRQGSPYRDYDVGEIIRRNGFQFVKV